MAIYRQTTAPTYEAGGLWFDSDDGDKAYYGVGGSWVALGSSTDFDGFTDVTSLLSTDTFLGGRSGGGINFTLATLFGNAPAVITSGRGVSTGDVAIEVGGLRSGDGAAFLDLHATSGADYEGRVVRYSGANGAMEIVQTGTGALIFSPGSSEKARITSAGIVEIGHTGEWTGGAAKLAVKTTVSGGRAISGWSSYAGASSAFLGRVDNASAPLAEWYYGASTSVGSITTTGTATAYNTSSDYRLKEDVRPVDDPIGTIMKLRPVNFAWKATGARADGFLAHEFGEVIPGAATGSKDAMREEVVVITPERPSRLKNPDGSAIMLPAKTKKQMVPDMQGIDQAKAVPVLVAAVQALVGEVTDLKAQVAALKAA